MCNVTLLDHLRHKLILGLLTSCQMCMKAPPNSSEGLSHRLGQVAVCVGALVFDVYGSNWHFVLFNCVCFAFPLCNTIISTNEIDAPIGFVNATVASSTSDRNRCQPSFGRTLTDLHRKVEHLSTVAAKILFLRSPTTSTAHFSALIVEVALHCRPAICILIACRLFFMNTLWSRHSPNRQGRFYKACVLRLHPAAMVAQVAV